MTDEEKQIAAALEQQRQDEAAQAEADRLAKEAEDALNRPVTHADLQSFAERQAEATAALLREQFASFKPVVQPPIAAPQAPSQTVSVPGIPDDDADLRYVIENTEERTEWFNASQELARRAALRSQAETTRKMSDLLAAQNKQQFELNKSPMIEQIVRERVGSESEAAKEELRKVLSGYAAEVLPRMNENDKQILSEAALYRALKVDAPTSKAPKVSHGQPAPTRSSQVNPEVAARAQELGVSYAAMEKLFADVEGRY